MLSRAQGLTVKSLFISMLYKRSRRSGIPALYEYHPTFLSEPPAVAGRFHHQVKTVSNEYASLNTQRGLFV